MRKGGAVLTTLLITAIGVISLYHISKSREFQFFGDIHSSIPNDSKMIALTFDDGPTENTDLILEKLAELDLKATFFVNGKSIEERPFDAIAIVKAGHELGNHTYSHDRMILKAYSTYRYEIDRTSELIRESGYEGKIFFRPPYGKKLFALPYYLEKIDMPTITWDVESETYLSRDASAKEHAEYILDNVKSGSIILLHPMYEPKKVMSALEIAVPELRKKGYAFVTVSELYDQRGDK